MNDHEIDRLVRSAAAPAADVTSPALAPLMAELREQIMTTTTTTAHDGVTALARPGAHPSPAHPSPHGAPHRHGRRGLRLAVAAAVTLAVSVAAVTVGFGSSSSTAYAAEVVEVAEAAPRLLVDGDGWEVTRADEFSVDQGETTFSDGATTAELFWRPAATHDDFVADRAAGADRSGAITVAGRPATLFASPAGSTHTALWLDGDHSVEFRIDGVSEATYRDVAALVVAVGVDTWLDALPASVVRPDDRSRTIDELLAGVPLPTDFDRSALDADTTSDRYQLGALVTGTVSCAWLDRWVAADAVGDREAMDEAASALATSTDWPVLHEMNVEGDYPEVVWEHASILNDGEVDVPAGSVSGTLTKDLIRDGSYVPALGCAPGR